MDRRSPRALTGEPVPEDALATMLEAARWAPSSYNAQPWRFVYALRGDPHWGAFLELLDEGNRAWARDAGALVAFVSRTTFERNGRPSRTHSFDAGAAWMSFALQATSLGWAAHGMEGLDYARARSVLAVPEHYRVEMIAAVGRPRDPRELDPETRRAEPPTGRKPLADLASAGRLPAAWS